jgi:excisionase family DNA binding protein
MTNTTSYPTEFESILTLSELAARLGVSAQTIYDLRSQGRGPRGFRIGRELKFRASEVDTWLRRLEEADTKPAEGGGR